jgi:periplasmic protein TonB
MANQPQDMLDIIFEDRNKAYGAYFLRRNYPTSMRNALGLGLALIILLFAFPAIMATVSALVSKPKVDVIAELGPPPDIENTPPPPPPPPVETPPPVTRPTIRFVPPIVKPDVEVKKEETPPDVADITVEVAKKTVEGDPNANVITENEVIEDIKKVEEVKAPPKDEEPLTFVEAMPQFPGGETELLKYLAQNIKYPAIARESGISGRVFLSFVVEKTGKITDIKVVKDIGGGCGKESVRVVESMPNWKPGNQNGNSVRVRMNLPVLFKLE